MSFKIALLSLCQGPALKSKETPTLSWLVRCHFPPCLSYRTLSWSISANLLKNSGIASRAQGTPHSQTKTCLEADFEILLKEPKSWIGGAGKGWGFQAHLSIWSQRTDPPHTGTCCTINLGHGALWLLFSTSDLSTKQAQACGRRSAVCAPLFSQPPSLPLRSGNANTFQYPPKANIIRKINQL